VKKKKRKILSDAKSGMIFPYALSGIEICHLASRPSTKKVDETWITHFMHLGWQ